MALCHQLLEQGTHCFYRIHQLIQFHKLSLCQFSPAYWGTSDVAEAKEQMPDFAQRKPQLPRTLNDCEAVKYAGVVASLPAEPLCTRKQANPLVIANRRRTKTNLPCHLRDGELRHSSF